MLDAMEFLSCTTKVSSSFQLEFKIAKSLEQNENWFVLYDDQKQNSIDLLYRRKVDLHLGRACASSLS